MASGESNGQDDSAVMISKQGINPSRIALPPGPWATVLDFLCERFGHIPRDQWHTRMEQGLVTDHHQQAIGPQTAYRAHQTLFYYRHVQAETPIPGTVRIVYEDELLVVADKPHFLPVTPAGQYVQETLLTRLRLQSGLSSLTPIHRIDRETAGLVVFCRQEKHRNAYQRLFRERAVSKTYEAIAPYIDVPLPLVRCSHLTQGEHFMQMKEVQGPINAHTDIDLIEDNGRWARYRLRPLTGQKHQLRVHMLGLGIPIVYDTIYPTLGESSTPDFARPLQLLAKHIAFDDPVTGLHRAFESSLHLHSLAQVTADVSNPTHPA